MAMIDLNDSNGKKTARKVKTNWKFCKLIFANYERKMGWKNVLGGKKNHKFSLMEKPNDCCQNWVCSSSEPSGADGKIPFNEIEHERRKKNDVKKYGIFVTLG